MFKRSVVKFFQLALNNNDCIFRWLGGRTIKCSEAVSKHASSSISSIEVVLFLPGIYCVEYAIVNSFRGLFEKITTAHTFAFDGETFSESEIAVLIINSSKLD
jgi:hypothetical protein